MNMEELDNTMIGRGRDAIDMILIMAPGLLSVLLS